MTAEPTPNSTNYSRWMTDSFDAIKHLKLFQLALPSAHNSGADKGAIDFIGEKWTACQDGRFIDQLKAGARVLDLRLADNSYGKIIGNNWPQYEFREVFELQHGSWGNRRLEHLISDVNAFAQANPREIIILDFHKYDKGRDYAYNSLERCLKHLQGLRPRLLPRIAESKTLEQIYADHPGANVIVAFKYGAPANWPEEEEPNTPLLWDILNHEWAKDYSEHGVEQLIIDTMASPPLYYPWALSATVYIESITGGPKHLGRDHPIRTLPFAENGRIINILMCDFIERADTLAGVVDRCIALTLQVGRDITPPSAPTNFIVRQLRLGDEGADREYYENTTLFSWDRSNDDTAVRHYQIFQNGGIIYTVSGNELRIKDFNKLNSKLKVRAVDLTGNVSGFSNEVELIQDTVPPTMPTDLKFAKYGYPTVKVEWAASSDGNGIGVAGYELRVNEVYQGYTTALSYEFHNVPADKVHLIEIRAKDRNGNYSEWAGLLRPALPRLVNPQIVYVPLEMGENLFRAVITWDSIPFPHPAGMKIALIFVTDSIPLPMKPHDYTYAPTYTDYAIPGDNFHVKASVFIIGTGEESPQVIVDLDVDLTLPLPAKNFKIASQTDTTITLGWDKSQSPDVVSYAISFNEKPPALVPASQNSFQSSKLEQESYPIEIWAINGHGNPSIVESLQADGPSPVPEPPRDLQVKVSGASSAYMTWSAPADPPESYVYSLLGQDSKTTANAYCNYSDLPSNTEFTFEVRAQNNGGQSDPVRASFKTGTLLHAPRNLRVIENEYRRVSFAWEPPVPAGDVTGYRFKVFPDGRTRDVAGLSHTENSLPIGGPVTVGVQSLFTWGESEWTQTTLIPRP
jgi:hypothetical protein